MLIIGCGGAALDLLAMLEWNKQDQELCFYDDCNPDLPKLLYGKYRILKKLEAAQAYFLEEDPRYTLGIGVPKIRYRMAQQFDSIGGQLVSLVSEQAQVARHASIAERGVIVMPGSILTNEVSIGEGTLINMRCTLGHSCRVGRFCELAPGVLASSSVIGDFSQLGINAVLKPGVTIGRNVLVGAGAVVLKDVPDHWIVAGNPAKKIGEQESIDFITNF